jgi:hypothetical protein
MKKDKKGKEKGDPHHHSLGDQKDRSSGEAVRNDPAPEEKEEIGDSAGKGKSTQIRSGVGNFVKIITLGGCLHPGACERYKLTEVPEAEVPKAKKSKNGGKGVGRVWRSAGLFGAVHRFYPFVFL